MQTDNLARLHQTTPGAARATAWDKDGKEVEAPTLADGDREQPARLPKDCSAFGVSWAVAHVTRRAEAFFRGRLPPAKSLELQVFDGEQWVPVRDGLECQPRPAENSIRFSFEPVASRQMRIVCEHGPVEATELEIYPYVPATRGKTITWPERMVTNALERQLLARREEPSFEGLSLYGLSMPVWAMMGMKDGATEQAVGWDGQIVAPRCRVHFTLGDPPRGLADVRDTVRRRLVGGWLPGVIVAGRIGQIELRQTSFVTSLDEKEHKDGIFIRIELRNLGRRPFKGVLRAHARPQGKAKTEFRDGVLVSRNTALLAGVGNGRAGKEDAAIAFDLEIPPGGKEAVELVSPVGDVSVRHAKRLAALGYAAALRRFRAYWKKLLAPAMKLGLPEPRLNDLYRSVLTQLFINAQGNVMPYGSIPSAYDGKLYGLEEGYAMMALAVSGLHEDAQRYMDGTYLTKAFLQKVEKYRGYGDRHQQYRNGLQPSYAVQAYRLSRDRKWISRHVPLLKECAEWTIANRRKTTQLKGDDKPLHWGLLPKWSYGGDLAEQQCYPLYANFACWRGMKETAWLLGELGDAETAARYEQHAREYRKLIQRVVDRIYRADAKPPFLPPHVYATSPAGREYYQLFAGCILDLMPFDLTDKRANYLGDFLEQDNRTFCLLPRFRRDVAQGGLDAIYGLGYLLTKLHQDKIKQFLLGFYAYQVFNMEHTCFTSRETNAIYASDLHLRTRFAVPEMSDPLPCSGAVVLLLLRHMLLTEETRAAGDYSGNLLLLFGAPRKWFRAGQTVGVGDAPTHFGKVSFHVTSRADRGAIEAEVTAPERNPCNCLKLRLRHPSGKKFKRVLVNGKAHARADPRAELIEILRPAGKYRIQALY